MDDALTAADRNMLELWTGLCACAGGAREDGDGLRMLSSGIRRVGYATPDRYRQFEPTA